MKTLNDYKIWENPDKCEIKITNTEKLKESKWLETENISYEVDGVPAKNPWEKVVRTTKNGVIAVLPITSEGNIILTEELRVPMIDETCNGRMIGMPAGLVEDNDTKKTTVEKEMQEEIGFESEQIEYVDSIASSEGMTNEEVDIFIALNVTKVDKLISNKFEKVNGFFLKHEAGENIKAIYSVPYKEIYDFMDIAKKDGLKKGGKIDCALNHFERKFKHQVFNK